MLVAGPPQSGPSYTSSVGTANLLHPSRQWLPLLVRPQGWAVISWMHQQPTSRQMGSHGPRQPQRRGGTEQHGLVKGSDRLPDKRCPDKCPPDSWGQCWAALTPSPPPDPGPCLGPRSSPWVPGPTPDTAAICGGFHERKQSLTGHWWSPGQGSDHLLPAEGVATPVLETSQGWWLVAAVGQGSDSLSLVLRAR